MSFIGRIILLNLLLWTAVGCKPAQETRETVQQGAKTLVTQPDRAKVMADLAAIRTSLQSWFAQNNSYPAQLKDLNLPLNVPDDLTYDSATGQVKSKTFPNL